MTTEPVYLTADGLQKLETTLTYLKTVKFPQLIEQLHDTSAGGYTIDNTEFIVARAEIDQLQARIDELEQTISTAQIIAPSHTEVIGLGSCAVVQIEGEEETETYTIVGAAEADPSAGFISNVSPFGRALLNHKMGDTVVVKSPDGELVIKIITVS